MNVTRGVRKVKDQNEGNECIREYRALVVIETLVGFSTKSVGVK